MKFPLSDFLDKITIQSAQRRRRYHLLTANINAFKTTIEKYWKRYRFVAPDPSTDSGASFIGIARHSDSWENEPLIHGRKV